jgi:hypothetical protein
MRRAVSFAALAALAIVGCAEAEAPGGPPRTTGASSQASEAGPSLDDGSDASEPDAGSTTGSTPDASTDASSGPVPCGSLPLGDGFESDIVGGPPSASRWSVVHPDCMGSGKLAVDDSQAHTGTRSVKVTGGGGYCDHVFLADTTVMPDLGPEVYARFFVRLETALGQGHTSLLAMTDANDGGHVRMGGQDAILMYNRESDDATLPTLSPTGVSDSVALVAGTWTCVEFHIDESAGTVETWVDGTLVPGLVENGTPVADISTQWLAKPWKPKLTDFGLGWESYAGQTMNLWFDDVALDSQRIGCGLTAR